MGREGDSCHISGAAYGVPDTVEQAIRKRAYGIASTFGHPDAWEDLAQEGRLAVWRMITDGNDQDPQHLIRQARERMIDVSRRGKSLDSQLHGGYLRSRIYTVVSLQEARDEDCAPEEHMGDPTVSVEEQALGNVVMEDVEQLLRPTEVIVFRERLADQQGEEIVETANLRGVWELRQPLKRVRDIVAGALERTDLLERDPDGRGRLRDFSHDERAEMARLYTQEDYSLRELGQHFECSPHTIRKTLRDMEGVTMRPAVNPRPGVRREGRYDQSL